MAFLTQRYLDRRTVLKGIGVSVALPLLEAMVPARSAHARQLDTKRRFVAIEMVHGSAGSTAFGEKNHLWSPAQFGRDFDLTKTSLEPLEPYRQHLTIVSRTDWLGAGLPRLRQPHVPVPRPDVPEERQPGPITIGLGGPEEARGLYLPLIRGAAANLEMGAAAALTGPVRRGDAETVAAHLRALSPGDRQLYVLLAREALRLAREAGLSGEAAERVERALGPAPQG